MTSGQTQQSASSYLWPEDLSTNPCIIHRSLRPLPRCPRSCQGRRGPSWHWSSAGEGRSGRAYPEGLLAWVGLEVSFPSPVMGCMDSPRHLHQAPRPTGLLSPQPAHLEKTVGQALCLQSMFQKEQSTEGQAGQSGALADIQERLGMTIFNGRGQPPRG